MDDITFDTIAKAVVIALSRRGALRLLAGTVITGLFEGLGSPEVLLAGGHKKHKKHKKKKPQGCSPLQTKCGNTCCHYGTFCCAGFCWPQGELQCCGTYTTLLEYQCCPSPHDYGCRLDQQCCGTTCCDPGKVCRDGECRTECSTTCSPGWFCCKDNCVQCPGGQEPDPATCLCQICEPNEEQCGGQCCRTGADQLCCEGKACHNKTTGDGVPVHCCNDGLGSIARQGYVCCLDSLGNPFSCEPGYVCAGDNCATAP